MTPIADAYAELAATSNYSFLRGASHPHEMVDQAKDLGLAAVGIADRNSLAGVVRAHVAAKAVGLRLLVGARLVTAGGFQVIAYPRDIAAYGRLVRLLTQGNRRAAKGDCHISRADILAHAAGQIFIIMPPRPLTEDWRARAEEFIAQAPKRRAVYLALSMRLDGADAAHLHALSELAKHWAIAPVVVGDALYHAPERRVLQDVVTCIRRKVTIDEASYLLEANAERYLKPPGEMARLFAGHAGALANTVKIASRLDFSLDEIAYQYPDEILESGEAAITTLRRLTATNAKKYYPGGMPAKVRATIEHELAIIKKLDYAPYFLTVYDLVRYARSRGILCQGRGSAANSAVCYVLGITSVDPARIDLLFERFLSAERNEPPDIDVDFEHERREEVIQYVYEKYGRHRAALTAVVITYRARSAVREVGKALGLSLDMTTALAKTIWGWSAKGVPDAQVENELGFDLSAPRLRLALDLSRELIGFPRHLSQHPGGFVITRDRLDEIVPVHNAAMDARTCVEWDKDDLDALGILKVDVLGLGMLTCIAKAFALAGRHYDAELTLANIPGGDKPVYDMICDADTVGVFQIESRAQMTMLPRLKPRKFYDLVIEVAIVRPGPIQGDMVHPYLRRRDGLEPVDYPSPALEAVLGKTLGVPLFQEQAMQIAIIGAGFAPAEADKLRRAMATFRHVGTIHTLRQKFLDGMQANGYTADFATRCFSQIEGFGEYGFPESHAASFALLAYISAWLKHHYPDVFLAAILNSQPMGFYGAAQLVRDARQHGVTVLAPDVNASEWDHILVPLARRRAQAPKFAVRLGLRQIKGFAESAAARIIATRQAHGHFKTLDELRRRAALSAALTERLADADALTGLALDRREGAWEARAIRDAPLPLFDQAGEAVAEAPASLPVMAKYEHVAHDYTTMRLSLKGHPLQFFRAGFARRGCRPAATLATTPDGTTLAVAGLVMARQRPGTASGVIFATLEDETGIANIVVWPRVFERYRRIVMTAKILRVSGRLQREGKVIHLIADALYDHTDLLARLAGGAVSLPNSRDFH